MAETPVHRKNLNDTIETLDYQFIDNPMVYVSGNMLMYYEKGKPNKQLSPDVFVVFGIPKTKRRDIYALWLEGKGPDAVFEYTSKSTRREDLSYKFHIYEKIFKVTEYFLFDPYEEYLEPAMQGYRLRRGDYMRIEEIDGRIPSKILGLHLERDGMFLRLYDVASGKRLPTPQERAEQAEAGQRFAEAGRRKAEAERDREAAARHKLEQELARLRGRSANGNRHGRKNGNDG